jgi:hypothetical protein
MVRRVLFCRSGPFLPDAVILASSRRLWGFDVGFFGSFFRSSRSRIEAGPGARDLGIETAVCQAQNPHMVKNLFFAFWPDFA